MQASELEIFKEIPGYKAIMKAILRNQIQMLVQQLSEHVGDEAVLLTVSVSDGTFSHLGSESGKVFVEDHDEIRTQFLGYCLKRHHRKKAEEASKAQVGSGVQFQNSQPESATQYYSAPVVHRNSHAVKRPSPYTRPVQQRKTSSQQLFTDKQLAAPAVPPILDSKHQYKQDFQLDLEFQQFSSELVGDSKRDTEMKIEISNVRSGNIPATIAAGLTTDVNVNDEVTEQHTGFEIKKETVEEAPVDVDSIGGAESESRAENNGTGDWETGYTIPGDGTLDESSQEHVDGETTDGKFRMVVVEAKERKTRRELPLEQRVYALKLLSSGLSSRKTAAAMGVGKTQIQQILKKKDKILADWQDEKLNPERKSRGRVRRTGNEEINSMCLKWYNEAVANGHQISGTVLQAKALEFAVQLGILSFKASNGWLESFRKRHIIVTPGMSPKGSANETKINSELEIKAEVQYDDSVLPEEKTAELDESDIQVHVEISPKHLNTWTGDGEQAYQSETSGIKVEASLIKIESDQDTMSHVAYNDKLTNTASNRVQNDTDMQTSDIKLETSLLKTEYDQASMSYAAYNDTLSNTASDSIPTETESNCDELKPIIYP